MATEYEIIEKLDRVCKNILNASKNQLYISMKYLGMAFDGLRYALSNETNTLGTDGFYLFYSPAFLMEKYQRDSPWINRAYIHMVIHCIFKHPVNMEDRDERLWHVSSDIVTEYLIDGFRLRLLKRNMSSLRRMVYDELNENIKVPTAESVYRFLINNDKLLKYLEKIEEEFCMDDHGFWIQYSQVSQNVNNDENSDNSEDNGGNNEDSNDDNEGDRGNSGGDGQGSKSQSKKDNFNEKWRSISEKAETDMETFSRNEGKDAGDMTEFLKVENKKRYNYGEFLRKFTVQREVMQLDLDSYDYIYYTYGLRTYGNMPLIENLEYKETNKVEEFVIVIDTSASCESDLVRRFLEETYSILRDSESFFRKINVHIIQCDSKVQSDDVIVNKATFEEYMQKFEIKGRGGTDFTAAFDYVNTLCHEKKLTELKGLIYFTDGYGVFPKKMPSYETAFVFVDDSYDDKGVPSWATEIVLGSEEIYEFGMQ